MTRLAPRPEVSVVLPTRNRRHMLETTLRSVLWQADVELEVIVVDEASTDGTARFLELVRDPRVRVLRHTSPRGLSSARNHGAATARGEWMGFIDDDDVWAPDKLSAQVSTGEATGRDWVYVGVVNVGDSLEIVSGVPPPAPEDVAAALPRYNPIPGGGSNVIIRRRLWEEAGTFDPGLRACEDWDLWARLARHHQPAVVDRPLMGYRLHGTSMSLDVPRMLGSVRTIQDRYGPVDWGRVHRWLGESCLRNQQHVRALVHYGRAAASGQGGGVAGDVASILRRKLTPARQDASPSGWKVEAARWLDELQRSPM